MTINKETSAASHFHLKTNRFFSTFFLLTPPHTLTPPFHHFLEDRGATKPYPSNTMDYKRQGIHATLLSKTRRIQTMYRIHFFIRFLEMTIHFFSLPFQFKVNIRKIKRTYDLTGLVWHRFRNLFWGSWCRWMRGRVLLGPGVHGLTRSARRYFLYSASFVFLRRFF